jgi:hypothetical protein
VEVAVSDSYQDLTGSAARQHESTGGNVLAGNINLPARGDAARQAEPGGEAVNAAHGVGAIPRERYRGAVSIRLSPLGGAGQAASEARPDLSTRKASDYLPPRLKAQLITEGKLSPDGTLAVLPQSTGAASPGQRTVPAAGTTGEAPPPDGGFASLSRFFRKLFSLRS